MRKPLSIILTLAMVVTMVIGSAGSVFAATGAGDTSSTTMKIAGTDGTVTITTDKGKEIAAKVDTKLLNGYTIKTAAASYCFISLDDSKAIKLGQNTKVKVEKSNKKIELSLKSGEIFFDVDKKLSGNESMNIKTGNMTTGIRGTSGVTIVSHNMYSITPDASGIKPQETASNTLFQLFSGSTVVKENNPNSLKSLLGRLLSAVPGTGAKIDPIKTPGPITAQAGQQIAIAAAPKGGGETTASRFETQALAVNEFGARAVLEAAAIKTGMSAGEALAADTGAIVAKVGDVTLTLENAGVAQAAVTQVAEAASDPAKLDSAKQNAELQAALAELTNTETIDTAKQDAAKADGTSTNDKALEKVEVKTDAGANASALSLSEDGTSTAATAGVQAKPSSSSHSSTPSGGGTQTGGGSSSGGSQQEGLLTAYTGTYDGQAHPITSISSELFNNWYFWVFTDEAVVASFVEEYGLERAGESSFNDIITSFASNYQIYIGSSSDIPTVTEIADSGNFYYVAVSKPDGANVRTGQLTVTISEAGGGSGTGGSTGTIGPSSVDGSFFSNQGPWDDYTTYDIAFIAESVGNTSTYTKYCKGTQDSDGATIGEVFDVLKNPATASYGSIYIDTGVTKQAIPSELAELQIKAGGYNRAVFISGAGFESVDTGYISLSTNDSTSELFVKLGYYDEVGNAPTTKLDKYSSIMVGQRVKFSNHGELTVGNNMQISGDVQNYGKIYISAAATGSLDPIKIFSGGILEQYDGGMIWDKREIKINSNSSLTGGRTTYGVESGGTMKLWGGSLRRSVTNTSVQPDDYAAKVEMRVRAIFSVQGTERVNCNAGAYEFRPVGSTKPEPATLVCTYTGDGTVLGVSLDAQGNRIFNTGLDDEALNGTFWVTNYNSLFDDSMQECEEWFVEITFPHEAGEFVIPG